MYELSSAFSKPIRDRSQVKLARSFVKESLVKTKINTERIFVIAKPEPLTELMAIKLRSQGYELEIFHDGISAAIAIHQREPDLVIADWTVPFLRSRDVYYSLRSTNKYVPAIALTEDTTVTGRIKLLDAGADCCLSKPFALSELMAIIQARLRQNRQEKSPILVFKDLKLDTLSREAIRNNRRIFLTAREFNLLEYLMQHPLQVLTRVQIIETIWGIDFTGNSNIIEVYVRYLRMKLEAAGEKRIIHTVRSVGYVLRSQS